MGISAHAIASGEELLKYIPQRWPIVMVDAFFGVEEPFSVSGLTVRPGNIFVEHGLLNEPGIIEHIAQSCALRVGYSCAQRRVPVPLGYIAAVKNMTFHTLPAVGDTLTTTVKILQDVFDITLVSAEVKRKEETIATCELKIFLKK
jgi:3-hydroxymyristoyl/3-hydroxydecanoyl-(acyl carrier protein) dehydratase